MLAAFDLYYYAPKKGNTGLTGYYHKLLLSQRNEQTSKI